MEMSNPPIRGSGEVLPGTLEMLILKTLTNNEQLNGAEIAESIHRASAGALAVKEGALYPALHRLEQRELVECRPGFSRNNRHAIFCRVTTKGMEELEEQRMRWVRLANGIGKIMENP